MVTSSCVLVLESELVDTSGTTARPFQLEVVEGEIDSCCVAADVVGGWKSASSLFFCNTNLDLSEGVFKDSKIILFRTTSTTDRAQNYLLLLQASEENLK